MKRWFWAAAVCVQAACAVPQTAADDAAALRRVWRVEGLNDAKGRSVAVSDGRLDLGGLPEAHTVLGCNGISFQVKLEDGGRLAFDDFVSTLKYCVGEMAAERAFQEVFEHIRRYRVQGDTLDLLTEDGRRVMRLRAQ